MSKSVDNIKALLKSKGYQFNRRWTITIPMGKIENSKLGGWNGLELWFCSNEGLWKALKKHPQETLDRIYAELETL